jgi:hypothetical protein
MNRTLPEGWTGNDADHHREVGAFRIQVRKHARSGRYFGEVRLGGALVCRADAYGYATATDAREAATNRALQVCAEVVAILSMEAARGGA